MSITDEMVSHFLKRTEQHIRLVRKYIHSIIDTGICTRAESDLLRGFGETHDLSKYKSPEALPYIYISWNYKMKRESKIYKIPENINATEASLHHVRSNRHHPEYWAYNPDDNMINSTDRDANPEKPIIATDMPKTALAEMVADWCAMSEELGTNTPKEWATEKVGTRWIFTDSQTQFIYSLIDLIWDTE